MGFLAITTFTLSLGMFMRQFAAVKHNRTSAGRSNMQGIRSTICEEVQIIVIGHRHHRA